MWPTSSRPSGAHQPGCKQGEDIHSETWSWQCPKGSMELRPRQEGLLHSRGTHSGPSLGSPLPTEGQKVHARGHAHLRPMALLQMQDPRIPCPQGARPNSSVCRGLLLMCTSQAKGWPRVAVARYVDVSQMNGPKWSQALPKVVAGEGAGGPSPYADTIQQAKSSIFVNVGG